MKLSPSGSEDRWLHSVTTAFDALARQWSALLTTIQSARPPGWQVSYEFSSSTPRLSVSRVQLSSLPTGDPTGISFGIHGSPDSTLGPSSTAQLENDLAQFAGVGPSPYARLTHPATTRAPWITLKRATWRSGRRRSGR